MKKKALKFESWNTVFKREFGDDEKATEKALKWYKSAHNSSSNFSKFRQNPPTKQLNNWNAMEEDSWTPELEEC